VLQAIQKGGMRGRGIKTAAVRIRQRERLRLSVPPASVHHDHQRKPSGRRPGSNSASKTRSPLFAHFSDFNCAKQAALENSFSGISSIPTAGSEGAETSAGTVSTVSDSAITTPATTSEPQPVSDASAEPVPGDAHDEWRAEYESNLAKWKHENAVQREKAEKVRGEWEAKRSSIGPTAFVGTGVGESEPELGEHLAKIQRGSTGELGSGWEEVSGTDSPAVISSNITPVRFLVFPPADTMTQILTFFIYRK